MARLNRQALVEELYLHDDIENKAAAKRILDSLFDLIKDKVNAGDTIAISGFGKFELYTRLNGEKVPKFRVFAGFTDPMAAE